MTESALETETLARLYLEQGHPERAEPIYRRLLEKDPHRSSLVEGLRKCREAQASRGGEEADVKQKRFRVLQELLARLTGDAPRSRRAAPAPGRVEAMLTEGIAHPVALPPLALPDPVPVVPRVAPVALEALPASPPSPVSQRERRWQVLHTMLQRLTAGRATP